MTKLLADKIIIDVEIVRRSHVRKHYNYGQLQS